MTRILNENVLNIITIIYDGLVIKELSCQYSLNDAPFILTVDFWYFIQAPSITVFSHFEENDFYGALSLSGCEK